MGPGPPLARLIAVVDDVSPEFVTPPGTARIAAPDGVGSSSDMPVTTRWSREMVVAFSVGLATSALVHVMLLPAVGYRFDMDQFVIWIHGLAVAPFGDAYRMDVGFPPVMVYIFGVLAAIEPAFRAATDATDTWIRVLMKVPGSIGDLGLVLTLAFALRQQPRWALVAGIGIALHPAVIWDSVLWGQYDSLYVLAALIGVVLAVHDRPLPAAAALAVSVMTKPQALPFLVPFAAWYLARYGMRATLKAIAVGLAVIVTLWLPFMPAGGPGAYLANVSHYQAELYNALSLRAWNVWWFLQQLAGGGFASDSSPLVGPIPARTVGYILTALGEAYVFVAVWRRPSPRVLVLGLACATLVAFCFLTTMHERYAYGAVVFLALLVAEQPLRWVWIALSVVFTLDLVAAIPTQELGTLLPSGGVIGEAGSVAMVGITALLLWTLARTRSVEPASTGRPATRPSPSFEAA